MSARPDRETATAQLRASGVWLQGSFGVWLMLAGRCGVTSATASAPVFCANLTSTLASLRHRFRRRLQPYVDGNSTPARSGCQDL